MWRERESSEELRYNRAWRDNTNWLARLETDFLLIWDRLTVNVTTFFFLLIRSRLLWSPGLDNVELAYTLWALRAAMMNDINDPISIVFSDSVWSDKIVIVSLSSLSEIWILPAAESGEDFITFPRCHHCWFFFSSTIIFSYAEHTSSTMWSISLFFIEHTFIM